MKQPVHIERTVREMSKYTTEVRYICEVNAGLSESVGGNDVATVIANSREKIFNFDFPIFDEAYRSVLETKILKHFYTREIGEETVGLWKLRLDTKLNEIMPYYNKLYMSELIEFNPLYTDDLTRKGNRKNDTESNGKNNVVSNGNADSNTSSTNINLYSDTPQGSLVGVENETYLTNASKDINSATGHSTNNGRVDSTDDRKLNSVEDYIETVSGFSHMNPSEMILKYRETFLNIDMMIINDLEVLFMQLW